MADIKKPAAKKKATRTPPPLEAPTPNNLEKPSKSQFVGLNLSVTPEFRKEYKTYAIDHDMTMVELLSRTFEFYKQHNK